MSKGIQITKNTEEYILNIPMIQSMGFGSATLNDVIFSGLTTEQYENIKSAVEAYVPSGGGGGGSYADGYADGSAAMESTIASSQAVTANLYKSKLASEDATIAAADSTDIDGQGTIFSESYQYLKTSAEMQANYNSGYTAGETAGYTSGYSAGETAGETTGYTNGQSAAASSQATVAGQYKTKLSSDDADIAAADATTLAGQGTIFSESYQYLKTTTEMQANYDSGYNAGYSAGGASAASRIAELELEVSGLEREIETLEDTMSSFALCIESEGTSTISFNTYVGQGTITNGYYKINDGSWTPNPATASITITQNDRLYLKADYAEGGSSSGLFNITGDYINISGSFDALLVNSSKKALKYLFKNCTLLKRCDATMPSSMYYIPNASSGDDSGAFSGMFSGCTSLINAPELPYVTLYKNCYKEMFKGCTSLTVAPSLPASTLHDNCYYSMFEGCTSLTAAPDLPAQNTTSKATCYYRMFYGCTSLSSITVSATNWSSTTAIDWVSGVSATGTFTKPTGTSIPTGTSGIPSGWTVVDV